MKRLLIILITVLLSVSLFAQQNTFKYEIRANGGLRVGSSVFPKIDSITLQAGKLRIMSGATLQKIAGHVLEADTAAMLSHYALKSDINILSTRVDSIVDVLADSIDVEALLQIDFDTDTLAKLSDVRSLAGSGVLPIFVFGAGGGMPTDTATFQNNVIAGAFYNSGSDTFKITSIRGVLAEGTGTETIGVQISWHSTLKSASAVNLNSSAFTVTSITTGDEDISFDNDEIPPSVWIWCTLSGASANNKPTLLSLTMSGYKIPTN